MRELMQNLYCIIHVEEIFIDCEKIQSISNSLQDIKAFYTVLKQS